MNFDITQGLKGFGCGIDGGVNSISSWIPDIPRSCLGKNVEVIYDIGDEEDIVIDKRLLLSKILSGDEYGIGDRPLSIIESDTIMDVVSQYHPSSNQKFWKYIEERHRGIIGRDRTLEEIFDAFKEILAERLGCGLGMGILSGFRNIQSCENVVIANKVDAVCGEFISDIRNVRELVKDNRFEHVVRIVKEGLVDDRIMLLISLEYYSQNCDFMFDNYSFKFKNEVISIATIAFTKFRSVDDISYLLSYKLDEFGELKYVNKTFYCAYVNRLEKEYGIYVFNQADIRDIQSDASNTTDKRLNYLFCTNRLYTKEYRDRIMGVSVFNRNDLKCEKHLKELCRTCESGYSGDFNCSKPEGSITEYDGGGINEVQACLAKHGRKSITMTRTVLPVSVMMYLLISDDIDIESDVLFEFRKIYRSLSNYAIIFARTKCDRLWAKCLSREFRTKDRNYVWKFQFNNASRDRKRAYDTDVQISDYDLPLNFKRWYGKRSRNCEYRGDNRDRYQDR